MNAPSLRMGPLVAITLSTLFFVGVAPLAQARVGVGVGSGKINIQKPMHPGGIYELPLLPVLNTGDEEATYGISVAYNTTQPELRPAQEWFVFSPATFNLTPGESKAVYVQVRIPVNVKPGSYFAYLQARPALSRVAGQTNIGIAAAAKLTFTVAPANIAQAAYYRLASLFAAGAPWTYVASIVIAAALLLSILQRYVHVSVGVRRK